MAAPRCLHGMGQAQQLGADAEGRPSAAGLVDVETHMIAIDDEADDAVNGRIRNPVTVTTGRLLHGFQFRSRLPGGAAGEDDLARGARIGRRQAPDCTAVVAIALARRGLVQSGAERIAAQDADGQGRAVPKRRRRQAS